MRKLHLTNATGRDATVDFAGLKPKAPPRLGQPGHKVRFKRFLASTDQGLDPALQRRFGDDYAQALIDGDPEVDLELIGREIGETTQVFLSSEGEVLYASPEWMEIISGPQGEERERRAPVDVEANVNEERPIRWTGRRIPRAELIRRFVIGRTVQIRHFDGLSYDYLHTMAKDLDAEAAVVLLGVGAGGREPLIFNTNGTPYRAFLEGRVDGERYQLLLHLSNMELKRPAAAGSKAKDQAREAEA